MNTPRKRANNLLHSMPPVQDDDLVGGLDGRESVGDDQRCGVPLPNVLQRLQTN
jgi:hypothetical protein